MKEMKKTVIFDLDGTISDPAEGITRSINYALSKLGYSTRPDTQLLKYIGPHLKVAFSELMGTSDDDLLMRAVVLFRERYIPLGYRENRLYKGMKEVLSLLHASEDYLCLATTKRKDMAESVLDFFEIHGFFKQVHGCDIHREKTDLLRDIISDPMLSSRPMVMIGDRDIDFKAASNAGMPSIAVRWGYGPSDELKLATVIAEKPEDLPLLIERTARAVV